MAQPAGDEVAAPQPPRRAKKQTYKTCRIILANHVKDYRAVIEGTVGKDDVVLEIGCCGGDTTARIAKRCKLAVGIDLSDFQVRPGSRCVPSPASSHPRVAPRAPQIAKAKRIFGKTPNLRFAVMDATDISGLCTLQKEVSWIGY